MSLPAADYEEDDALVDVSGLVGRVLADRYKVTGLLGAGGIGRVYRAEHLVLKREVALKVLLEHYQCVPDLQRRFEREAMALAALTHPNVVSIIDFVSSKELTFLVMELVDGRDLDDLLEEHGQIPPDEAFDIMEQILSSLAYAHEQDVIHRDLKPQNVLVRELAAGRKHPVILDFGLAKFMDGSGPSANLTKTGLIVGTPAYMAPEQASGAHADQRADVYAAGVMLFEMLSGEPPFDGEGQELIRQHLLKPAPSLASKSRGAIVAPQLEAFLERALAKDGADRFADGGAMLDALLALPPDSFIPSAHAASPVRAVSRAPTAIAAAPTVPRLAAAPERSGRGRWALVVAALVLGAAILGATWMFLRHDTSSAVAAAEPVEAPPAPAPPSAGSQSEDPTGASATEPAMAATETPEPVEVPEVEPVAEPSEPVAPRPAARNPWRRGVPRELARVRRRLSRGNPVTSRHIRAVTSYRREHPDDARATLLLAQIYMSRGQAVRALNQYQRAYRRDMTSRGDPRMRADLVRMAATAPLHDRATEALETIYGSEAEAAITRAMARARDVDDRARLEAALARVRPEE